jgi:hypothetical protein
VFPFQVIPRGDQKVEKRRKLLLQSLVLVLLFQWCLQGRATGEVGSLLTLPALPFS